MLNKKIVFLHFAKTSGQSVHRLLSNTFGNELVCPARTNSDISSYTDEQLNSYKVFSGHFDWAHIEELFGQESMNVFTILREPRERLLSYYFYMLGLSEKAKIHNKLTANLKMFQELTVDEIFERAYENRRSLLAYVFNNPYSYFLAGKTINSIEKFSQEKAALEQVIHLAITNAKSMMGIFRFSDLHAVEKIICELGNKKLPNKMPYLNNGFQDVKERECALLLLKPKPGTFEYIDKLCELDNIIFETIFNPLQ